MATMLPELSPPAVLVPRRPLHRRADCSANVTIQADIRRVTYALTIPEYIEAWLEVPGVERIACVGDDAEPSSFRLELYAAGKLRTQIRGRHCLLAPNHLMIVWNTVARGGGEDSLVDIRIRRMRQSCLVILRHAQLGASRKTVWSSAVWQHSLEKLAHLLEG